MVSLPSVENYATQCWPEFNHAVINIPDERKGEALIMFTDKKDAERSELSKFVKEQGAKDLMVPKEIRYIDKIPVLGTGKTDYVSLGKLVKTNERTSQFGTIV